MALWTDLITPAELTGYIRTALEDLEVNQPTLGRFLPNEMVSDISVRFVKGRAGLVAEASFRAFDAEPELAGGLTGQRVTLELPAIGQKRVISEYDQLRNRNASDDTLRASILKEARNVAKAIADRIERLRGTVLETGKATVNQANFGFDDDFGRKASHTTAAASLWNTPTVSRLTDLTAWLDIYAASNDGAVPGVTLVSRKGFRALASGDEFSLILANGTKRPGDRDSINATFDREGLPPIEIYDRSTSGGRVLSENKLLFLPAPVEPNGGDSQLGKSYWGRTLTSMDSKYDLADVDQPGVVVGAHKSETIPHIATVESDGIALPVLGNADLSFAARIIT